MLVFDACRKSVDVTHRSQQLRYLVSGNDFLTRYQHSTGVASTWSVYSVNSKSLWAMYWTSSKPTW